ncbi:hypothetical protein [Nocardia iowensis]|uniref:PH domain-containing protein n=1 Tax=Nocardia iowensis TaxID=204891 RepID=A0ABX8RRJ5_NOCIO|nr:hypothetical protein [Nocardia iowensis]QXN91866.1 hypothetical protein KV110_01335 [Nocardia iowensis]
MADDSMVRRVAAPTAMTAVVSTALAVVVNLATSSVESRWLWVAVAVLTVVGFVASLWLYRRSDHSPQPDRPPVGVDLGTVKARGFRIQGVRSTGDGVRLGKGRFRRDVDITDVAAGAGEGPDPS